MKFNLKNAIKAAEENGACSITKELEKYSSIQDVIKHYDKKDVSYYAYWIALRCPEWRSNLKKYITDSKWAYYWARDIGDREIMRDRVTDSQVAYYWAVYIGDREIMRDRVTEPEWIVEWIEDFPEDEDYFKSKGLL